MLHFILGRAGSGKTHTARKMLKDLARDGTEKLMLLVPEQYSFESERAMLRLLGAADAQRVQIFSFTRLADAVFREYGGIAGRRLDDGGKSILMSLALEEMQDQLPLFGRHSQTPELLQRMLSASAEMKLCEIFPDELAAAADAMEDGTLKEKTKEISLVLSCYDALVERSYLDPLDDLTRVRKTLLARNYFAGYTVVLDSFKSFTMQELKLLEIMLCQAKEVTVTLCTDQLDDPEHGMGLFSLVKRTARQVMRLAKENAVPVAPPVVLEPAARFRNGEMKALEENVFRGRRALYREKPDFVFLYRAEDHYDEAAFTAAAIRALVMEQGYRYRDFAVIVRSPEPYYGCLDTALERWEIPFFMDQPRTVDAEPLMHLVLSAFRAVNAGFRSEDIFAYLKTGLCGFSADEIARLENYTYLWKISGGKWKTGWTEHPGGFVEEFTEKNRGELESLNALRERVMSPLLRLQSSVREADGEGMAKAVFTLLEKLEAPKHLKALYRRLRDGGQIGLADQQLRLWDMLMEILNQTALTLKGHVLSAERYAELLRLVILSGDIASIPQGLDEVTVGAADRMRPNEPKAVFLLGACQGEFPQNPASGGVFSDDERKALIRLGLPLSDTLENVAVEERFLAYSAMTSPSERLFIVYPGADIEGAAKSPSSIVAELHAAFPALAEYSELMLPPEAFANAEAPAFELTARQWKQKTILSSTLKALFAEREGYQAKLKALDRAGKKLPFSFESQAKARALFERGRPVSATQIETYHLCKFQYFCRYGLGAKERKPAEIDALEYGSLMHFLLEKLLKEKGSAELAGLPRNALKQEIREMITQYADAKLGGNESKTPRFRFLLERLADSAQVVISHIAQELCQSSFEPAAFELEMRDGGEFPPLTISLPSGGSVTVEGKIDRMDLAEINGEKYVRIVDYKTGKKEFRLSDVLYGVNMQMLIYLAAIIERGSCRPAGILYMPANRPIVPAERGAAPEAVQKEVDKRLRMNGLLLEDADVVRAMEPAGAGKYIPVPLKNGEIPKTESAVKEAEMERLLRFVKGTVAGMAETLYRGDVRAQPLKGELDACAWCPYFAVCGHERDDGGTDYSHCAKLEALKTIEKLEGGEPDGQP